MFKINTQIYLNTSKRQIIPDLKYLRWKGE